MAAPRRYNERLVVTRPVTIAAAPGADVEVAWSTREPYQAVVEVDPALGQGLEAAGAVALRRLRLRHASPSIANNYAVRLVVSALLLMCGHMWAWRRRLRGRERRASGRPVRECCAGLLAGVPRSHSPTRPLPLRFPAADPPRYVRYCQGCGAVLEDCDISSATGAGVGIEGGAPALLRCAVHDCARHGAPRAGSGRGAATHQLPAAVVP